MGGYKGGSSSTVAITSGTINGVSTSRFNQNTAKPNGFVRYTPLFKRLGIAAPSGLSIASGGGIVATTGGTNGTGYITLPKAIDTTKKFRFSALIQIGTGSTTDSTNSVQVQLCRTDNSFTSGAYCQINSGGANIVIGGSASNTINAAIPAGTRLWFTIAGDGNRITVAAFPASTAPLSASQVASAYTNLYYQTKLTSNFANSTTTFANLTRIYFQNQSAQHQILGYFLNAGDWSGPNDSLLNPPFVQEFTNSGDTSCWVLVPGSYGGYKTSNYCAFHHPSGNSGFLYDFPTAQPTFLNLWYGGYIVFGSSGSGNGTIGGASDSCWSAPAGLGYKKFLVDYIRTNLPLGNNLVHLGGSMGGLNALAYELQFPGSCRGIATVSAAAGLTDSYAASATFANLIKAAFGRIYVCIQAGTGNAPASSPTFWTAINLEKEAPADLYYGATYTWRDIYAAGTAYAVNDIVFVASTAAGNTFNDYDPTLNTHGLLNVPIYMLHASDDSVVNISQMNNFATNLTADGGTVTATTRGSGHITTSVFDTAGIKTFFDLAVA